MGGQIEPVGLPLAFSSFVESEEMYLKTGQKMFTLESIYVFQNCTSLASSRPGGM